MEKPAEGSKKSLDQLGWPNLRQRDIPDNGSSQSTGGHRQMDHGKTSQGLFYQWLQGFQSRTNRMGCKWAGKIGPVIVWGEFSWIEDKGWRTWSFQRMETEKKNVAQKKRKKKKPINIGTKPLTIKCNLHSSSSILSYHLVHYNTMLILPGFIMAILEFKRVIPQWSMWHNNTITYYLDKLNAK